MSIRDTVLALSHLYDVFEFQEKAISGSSDPLVQSIVGQAKQLQVTKEIGKIFQRCRVSLRLEPSSVLLDAIAMQDNKFLGEKRFAPFRSVVDDRISLRFPNEMAGSALKSAIQKKQFWMRKAGPMALNQQMLWNRYIDFLLMSPTTCIDSALNEALNDPSLFERLLFSKNPGDIDAVFFQAAKNNRQELVLPFADSNRRLTSSFNPKAGFNVRASFTEGLQAGFIVAIQKNHVAFVRALISSRLKPDRQILEHGRRLARQIFNVLEDNGKSDENLPDLELREIDPTSLTRQEMVDLLNEVLPPEDEDRKFSGVIPGQAAVMLPPSAGSAQVKNGRRFTQQTGLMIGAFLGVVVLSSIYFYIRNMDINFSGFLKGDSV